MDNITIRIQESVWRSKHIEKYFKDHIVERSYVVGYSYSRTLVISSQHFSRGLNIHNRACARLIFKLTVILALIGNITQYRIWLNIKSVDFTSCKLPLFSDKVFHSTKKFRELHYICIRSFSWKIFHRAKVLKMWCCLLESLNNISPGSPKRYIHNFFLKKGKHF